MFYVCWVAFTALQSQETVAIMYLNSNVGPTSLTLVQHCTKVIQMLFVYWILWKMDQNNASNLFAIPFSNNLPNKHQADPAIMLQHSWGSSKQIPPCVDGGLHPDPCSLWYADTVDLFSCNLQCVCWLEDARNLISDSFHWNINPTKNIFLIQFNSPYTQEYPHFNYSSGKHDLNRV